MIAKFQQIIAEKVVATPPQANQPIKDGEDGKVGEEMKTPKPQDPKIQNPIEELKPIEPVEIAAPSPQKDLPSGLAVADSPTTYPLQPTTSSIKPAPRSPQDAVGNPNAILELTKADIFKLLGMFKIAETEKKKNLDEMEETIWQDFVEEDLPLMLREDQKQAFADLLKTSPSAEKIINFFGSPPTGGLPSNFEEKYLGKTLEFKAEIAKEQIETLLAAASNPSINSGQGAAGAAEDVDKKKILEHAKAAATSGFWKKVEDLMVNFG